MDDVVGTVLTDFFSGSVTQYTKSVEVNGLTFSMFIGVIHE